MRHNMKFQVYELILNEYVNHPTKILIAEVDAANAEEANKVARMMHPNKLSLMIDEQEFHS